MTTELSSSEEIVEIYTGLEIPLSQSFQIASSQKTKLVVIVGPVLAGKTTLISRIFDKFHDGPIDDWTFAGSDTIVGYESILRSYRSQNVATSPAVERTSLAKDPELFHLCLRKNRSDATALLLANLSGEAFVDLIQTQDAIEDLEYIKRASHLSVLIDGEKITNRAGRSHELRNAHLFLERLLQTKHISELAMISVVLAKDDIFQGAPGGEEYIRETMERIKTELIDPLVALGANLIGNPIRLISQPLKQCAGFGDILNVWAQDASPPLKRRESTSAKSTRMVDRYKAGRR